MENNLPKVHSEPLTQDENEYNVKVDTLQANVKLITPKNLERYRWFSELDEMNVGQMKGGQMNVKSRDSNVCKSMERYRWFTLYD
tara:strand:- start:254 stop:508 length:255 start_codon:yes stop_codon:yes gene_type:complete